MVIEYIFVQKFVKMINICVYQLINFYFCDLNVDWKFIKLLKKYIKI